MQKCETAVIPEFSVENFLDTVDFFFYIAKRHYVHTQNAHIAENAACGLVPSPMRQITGASQSVL